MRTNMDDFQDDGWEEEDAVVRKPRATRAKKAPSRRPEVDYKPLIIIGAAVLLVFIVIFSLGRGWQRTVDKKEINQLNESNAILQTKIQNLEKNNKELQSQVDSMSKAKENTTSSGSTAEGTTHTLKTGYNFRAEASVDSDILAELDEGTTVTIVKVVGDGWVQAKYNNQTGYLKCADELPAETVSPTGTDTKTASGEDEEA